MNNIGLQVLRQQVAALERRQDEMQQTVAGLLIRVNLLEEESGQRAEKERRAALPWREPPR